MGQGSSLSQTAGKQVVRKQSIVLLLRGSSSQPEGSELGLPGTSTHGASHPLMGKQNTHVCPNKSLKPSLVWPPERHMCTAHRDLSKSWLMLFASEGKAGILNLPQLGSWGVQEHVDPSNLHLNSRPCFIAVYKYLHWNGLFAMIFLRMPKRLSMLGDSV